MLAGTWDHCEPVEGLSEAGRFVRGQKNDVAMVRHQQRDSSANGDADSSARAIATDIAR